MTPQATLQKMSNMKLYGMAQAFQATMQTGFNHKFTADELIGHLVDSEWEERFNRKLKRRLKAAKFRYQFNIEQIDLIQKRNLDKNLLLRLSNCDWIQKAENVLITGPTGVGKTSIACALGHQACLNDYAVLYEKAIKLFTRLKYAKAEGSYVKELEKIQKQHVLIIDDFGLHPIDDQSKLMLLEILEDRYGEHSTIITAQMPVNQWYDFIANSTIADAVLDRIVHNSHRIELEGDSMRKIRSSHSG
jgi:DNA replication protein DnaC